MTESTSNTNRSKLLILTTFVFAMFFGAVGTTTWLFNLKSDLTHKSKELSIALNREEASVYGLQMSRALDAIAQQEYERARTLLSNSDPSLRGWEFDMIATRLNDRNLELTIPWEYGTELQASADGRYIALHSSDGLHIVDSVEKREISPIAWEQTGYHNFYFTPDSKYMLYFERYGSERVLVIELKTGRLITILDGYDTESRVRSDGVMRSYDGALCAAFSPDSSTLATGGGDGRVVLWDLSTWKQIGVLEDSTTPHEGYFSEIISIAYTPDGKKVLTTSRDDFGNGMRRFIVWDVATGKPENKYLLNLPPVRFATNDVAKYVDSNGNVRSLVDNVEQGDSRKSEIISGNGRMSLSLTTENSLEITDYTTANRIKLKPESIDVTSILCTTFSPNGDQVCCGTESGEVAIWDSETGGLIRQIKLSDDSIVAVACGVDASSIAIVTQSAKQDQMKFALHFPKEATPLEKYSLPTRFSIAFDNDSSRLVSLGDGDAWIWDLKDEELVAKVSHEDGNSIYDAKFSPDGSILATKDASSICLWSGERYDEPLMTLATDGLLQHGFEFSPDGKHIATTVSKRDDDHIIIWSLESRKDYIRFPFEADGFLAFVDDGRTLSIYSDMRGAFLERNFETLLASKAPPPRNLFDRVEIENRLTWNGRASNNETLQDSQTPVVVKGDRRVFLSIKGEDEARTYVKLKPWDYFRDKMELDAPEESVVTPDQKRLISIGGDFGVSVWDINTGVQLLILEKDVKANCIAISSDGHYLAVGTDDGIRLWNTLNLGLEKIEE